MFVQVALVALAPPTDHASQRRISLLEDELRRAARNYETFQHGRDRLHETTNHLIDEQRGTERSGLDQASEIAHLQAEIDVQQRGASNAPATGADQQIGDLRAQVTQQNTELQDLDRRLDRDRNQVLERELDLAGSKIDILCTQISNQEREIDDLRDTLATSDHSLIRVRDALRASANALTAARSDDTDLTALRYDLTRVQEMYADVQEEITKLQDSRKTWTPISIRPVRCSQRPLLSFELVGQVRLPANGLVAISFASRWATCSQDVYARCIGTSRRTDLLRWFLPARHPSVRRERDVRVCSSRLSASGLTRSRREKPAEIIEIQMKVVTTVSPRNGSVRGRGDSRRRWRSVRVRGGGSDDKVPTNSPHLTSNRRHCPQRLRSRSSTFFRLRCSVDRPIPTPGGQSPGVLRRIFAGDSSSSSPPRSPRGSPPPRLPSRSPAPPHRSPAPAGTPPGTPPRPELHRYLHARPLSAIFPLATAIQVFIALGS
ncbi:hypothetical protein GQ600_21952 [Phytophthora cactorum]|nr:hypothetical protein GQ600_21952 [Phytophthora cactorum]